MREGDDKDEPMKRGTGGGVAIVLLRRWRAGLAVRKSERASLKAVVEGRETKPALASIPSAHH
jgi:hypothetical protein